MNRRAQAEDLPNLVRGFPLLENLRDAAIEELTGLARCHEYPKNNILFYQGDPAGQIFLVLSGRVKINIVNEDGREVILALVRPGGFCGLVSALDGGPHPANAVTVEESRLARFDAGRFLGWLEGEHEMQQAVMRDLGGRVRQLYNKIGEHALMGVKERLLLTLLEIAEREGEAGPGGEIVFTRPTHRELANRIGSSREVVSRLLKEILDSEMLQAEGRVIRVPVSALVLGED